MKKNKNLFINILLSSVVLMGSFNNIYAYTNNHSNAQVYNISDSEESIENYENVVDALENEEYNSIKKVSIEEDENVISNSRFAKSPANKSGVDLVDGTYVIDRKDGWILEDDKGFIQSIIIPPGATGTISTSKTIKTSNSFSVVSSVEFNFSFVSAAVKAGYGFNAENASTISINQSIKAPADKSLFVKSQTVNRRFDTINVKNNRIVDLASTYIPVSHVLTSLEFVQGDKVNQNRLFEKRTRNIFGDQAIDNKHLTDQNVTYEKTAVLNNKFKYDFDLLEGASNTVGLYFDVQNTGEYSIGSSFLSLSERTFTDPVFSFGTGVDMTLYKVSNKNEKIIEKTIASIPTGKLEEDFTDSEKLQRALPRLKATLKKGEKYLLVINKDKSKSKYHEPGSKFSYTVYFN